MKMIELIVLQGAAFELVPGLGIVLINQLR